MSHCTQIYGRLYGRILYPRASSHSRFFHWHFCLENYPPLAPPCPNLFFSQFSPHRQQTNQPKEKNGSSHNPTTPTFVPSLKVLTIPSLNTQQSHNQYNKTTVHSTTILSYDELFISIPHVTTTTTLDSPVIGIFGECWAVLSL